MDVKIMRIIIEVYVVTEKDVDPMARNAVQYTLDQREQMLEPIHDAVEDLLRQSTTVVTPNLVTGVDFYVLSENEYINRARKKPPQKERR